MSHSRRFLAVLAAVPLLLGGCTSDDTSGPPAPAGSAPAVQLGAPGEPNRPMTEDELEALRSSGSEASPSDIAFARDMIPHHQQALRMAELAKTNGAGRDVQLLAERMRISQVDEIAQLERWLADQGPLPPDDHGRHGGDEHALMPGMLTEAEMSALAAARGAAFDRLFLTSMIRHHEGATAMVADLQTRPDHGQEVWIAQFAREVDLDQRVEIARMKGMLGTA